MMATASKGLDRRAHKTRQGLRQACLDVIREKGVSGASVQEIADRANVSRGTFYAHYTDKYALVESIIREEFQRALGQLPELAAWDRETIPQLIRIVLEHFRMIYQYHHRLGEVGAYLDRAVQEELNLLILKWLEQRHQNTPFDLLSPSLPLAAQTISWAIFGAAVHWGRESSSVSAEQAARDISRLILDGAASLPSLDFLT